MNNIQRIATMVTALLLTQACGHAFLDIKPNSGIVVPTRLAELRGLLDNEGVVFDAPLLSTQSADEYYLKDADLMALNAKDRNAYRWEKDVFEGQNFAINDWNKPYEQVFYANVVLDGLAAIRVADPLTTEWEDVKGTAHFLRAKAFFELAEVFAMPYSAANADRLPGIPLKRSPDINEQVTRGTLAQTYGQIISDLSLARHYLKGLSLPQNKIRPNRLTTYAMFARVYLAMGHYNLAGSYADSALQHYDGLIDFRLINPGLPSPFQVSNAETILQGRMLPGITTFTAISPTLHVDSGLYRLYGEGDLRKDLFFRKVGDRIAVKATYSGLLQFFTGLATDELYLVRAECRAREGDTDGALADLDRLLAKRYAAGAYQYPVATASEEALAMVLTERRKELAFRGRRWSDLRRLNSEGYGITIRRVVEGDTIALAPNDPRYALPIPDIEIEMSGLEQNMR